MRSAFDPCRAKVILHQRLVSFGPHRLAELGDEDSIVLHIGAHCKVGLKHLADLEVQGDGSILASLAASDPQRADVCWIPIDSRWQFNVIERQVGKLGKTNAGLKQKLDDGSVPGLVTARSKKTLVLLFGQDSLLAVFPPPEGETFC